MLYCLYNHQSNVFKSEDWTQFHEIYMKYMTNTKYSILYWCIGFFGRHSLLICHQSCQHIPCNWIDAPHIHSLNHSILIEPMFQELMFWSINPYLSKTRLLLKFCVLKGFDNWQPWAVKATCILQITWLKQIAYCK